MSATPSKTDKRTSARHQAEAQKAKKKLARETKVAAKNKPVGKAKSKRK